MKRLLALVTLSTALAIGTTSCAHQQLTKQHARDVALTAAVIAAIVLITVTVPCGNCDATTAAPAGIH